MKVNEGGGVADDRPVLEVAPSERQAARAAIFGQAGPKHGSAPDGGSTDFLPWFLTIEDAMWNCISCEMWSAYKMKVKNLICKCVPVLKIDGEWVRNPTIVTDRYVDDGEIVYGEYKKGDELKAGRALVKAHQANADFELLDKEVIFVLYPPPRTIPTTTATLAAVL